MSSANIPATSTPAPGQKLDYRTRLINFYTQYNPAKLGAVDTQLQKYAGYEEDLMEALVKKYGPEPTPRGTPITQSQLNTADICQICLDEDNTSCGELFQPCLCNSWVHRKCLQQWRYSGNNLRAYTHCPTCGYQYRVVTVTHEKQSTTRQMYIWAMLRLWLGILLCCCAVVGGFAGFSYLADRSQKNVPVAMKYALSSVVHGLPNKTDVQEWREGFKGDEHVWQYYGLLGVLCGSITALIVLHCLGVDDRPYEQTSRKRRQSSCCGDDDRETQYSSNTYYIGNPYYPYYGGYYGGYWYDPYCCYGFNGCYCDCDGCCTNNACGLCCLPDNVGCPGDQFTGCTCEGLKCDDCGEGGGDGAVIVILVIIIVIAAIIVISAVWCIIAFGVRRAYGYTSAYSARCYANVQETSGETKVLGRNDPDLPNSDLAAMSNAPMYVQNEESLRVLQPANTPKGYSYDKA